MSGDAKWQLTDLMARGIELSDERYENGLVGWVAECCDLIARDGDMGDYYRHELNR